MTCIVAMVENGVVHMAGDKCGSNGYTKRIVGKPKIFINKNFIIGYTTSFRMGQLLEFTWCPPEQLNSQSDNVYIYKTVVDSMKQLLKKDGFATDTNGGSFLFGYKGKLYEMQDDFSIFEQQIASVGCGYVEAQSVIYVLNKINYDGSIQDKLQLAIEASSMIKPGVSSEYDYLKL